MTTGTKLKSTPLVVWRALLRESRTWGICSRQAMARWHAWRPGAARSLCKRARDWTPGDGELSYGSLEGYAGGVADPSNHLCKLCLDRLMHLVSDDAPRVGAEMEAEFVGGPLDGARIALHVLHEEPMLTILGRTYERQGRPIEEDRPEAAGR